MRPEVRALYRHDLRPRYHDGYHDRVRSMRQDGSCGFCYAYDRKSCSFDAPCSYVKPHGDVVYST
jgi:hypothetical protein